LGTEVKGLVNLSTIEEAANRIRGIAFRTPLVESVALSRIVGCNVFLKLECYQPIRVFKIRGAYNKIVQLRGTQAIVAASSGNHGIAVSYCSYRLGKRCTVVVPENAVAEKLSAISEFGAKIVKFGRFHSEREVKAREIAEKTGAVFVKPFNDADVISGQGSIGLEILQDLAEVDSVFVPIGGGGLVSGVACAMKEHSSRSGKNVRIIGVEPEGAPSMYKSLKKNKIIEVRDTYSIADGLMPTSPGDLTFALCTKFVDDVLLVSDDEILSALRLLLKEAHVVAEPSGAASLAALLYKYKPMVTDENVVVVVSGGNISLSLLRQQLSILT
jgi:threonine dehydratase